MTQDNGMDVSPSWQELKDERDALREHVERMAGPLSHIVELWGRFERGEELPGDDDAKRWVEESRAALDASSTTSLARLKAQRQAELLEEYREELGPLASRLLTVSPNNSAAKPRTPPMNNQILLTLRASHRPLTIGELATRLDCEWRTAAKAVTRLHHQHYIFPDGDRRQGVEMIPTWSLTSAGKQLAAEIRAQERMEEASDDDEA